MDTKAKELERIWALVDRVRGRHLTLAGALRELAASGVPLDWRTVVRIASARGWDEGVPAEGAVDLILGYLDGRHVRFLLDPWAGPGVVLAALSEASIGARIVGRDPNIVNAEVATIITTRRSIEWETTDPRPGAGSNVGMVDNPDLVVCCPPMGLPDESVALGQNDAPVQARDSVGYLVALQAASQITQNGEAILVLPDSALFGSKPGRFRKTLDKLGLVLSAVVSLPPISVRTSLPSSLVILSRLPVLTLFVGRAFFTPDDAALIRNMRLRERGATPESGSLVDPQTFQSWWALSLERQIEAERPEGQSAHRLDEIAVKIISGDRSESGGFETRENAIYLPMIGTSPAVASVAELRVKPQNVAQITLNPSLATAEFVAAYFNSPLGRKVRERMCGNAIIPRATRSSVGAAYVYLPGLAQQQEAVAAQRQIEELRLRLDDHARELWQRPAAAPRIRRSLRSLGNEDPMTAWESSLPFPLASVLHSYRAHADARRRRDFLLLFFEATTEFASTVMLSAFYSDTEFYAANRRSLLAVGREDRQGLRRSSMGSWARLGAHLAKETRRMLSTQRELCLNLFRVTDATLPEAISSPSLFGAIDQVTGYRNDWRGHGGVESDRDVARRLDALESELQKVQRALADPFERVRIIRPLSSTFQGGVYRYLVQDLTGPTVPFSEVSLELLSPLEQDALHLCDLRNARALQLLPFVRMRGGPVAPNACYFFNRIDGDRIRWVSYHHEEMSEVFEPDPQLVAVLDDMEAGD